ARVCKGEGLISHETHRVARQVAPAVPAVPDTTTASGLDRMFTVATVTDEPDLFAVPEDAGRPEIAKRLLGDPGREASVQYVATGKIPVLDHKPARAVHIMKSEELTSEALTVLQSSLDAQLDSDVAKVLGILRQRLIGDADESTLTEITLRWS